MEIGCALLLSRFTLMAKELVLLGNGHKHWASASTFSRRTYEPENIVWQCFSHIYSGSMGHILITSLFTCTRNVNKRDNPTIERT